MIKNYLKTAFRILVRNKVFSLINIFGLSVGLTSVIVIFLFITHELNFDKHHSNFDRIYKVVNKQIETFIIEFLVISIIGLGLNNFILWIFHSKFKLNFYVAKLIAIGFVTIWNFLANYFITFKQTI